MPSNITMQSRDALSARLAECYVTIDNHRYHMLSMINFEALFEKTKSEVPILGRTASGNRATGWKGIFSGTLHYNTSIFRTLLAKYKETGKDIYFEIQVTNDDPTTTVGRQTVVLLGCNLDSGVLTKFDADGEYLDEEIEGTFEDFWIPDHFDLLKGMVI